MTHVIVHASLLRFNMTILKVAYVYDGTLLFVALPLQVEEFNRCCEVHPPSAVIRYVYIFFRGFCWAPFIFVFAILSETEDKQKLGGGEVSSF